MVVFGLSLIPAARAAGGGDHSDAFGVVLGACSSSPPAPALYRLGFRMRLELPTWHPGVRRWRS
jgi:hypothetical protein